MKFLIELGCNFLRVTSERNKATNEAAQQHDVSELRGWLDEFTYEEGVIFRRSEEHSPH